MAVVAQAACPDENTLGLLAEDAVPAGERAALEHHLDTCAACTRLVAELAQLAAPARAAPERYKIIRQLGAGAMGVVWEAEDTALVRKVALKFVRPENAGDRERRARLLREARALAQLRHPNVLAVHDVGNVGVDELFLALELVVGTNAREWRRAAPRTTVELLAVWRKVAAGLGAVHRAGIVHRDVKPDNVLVAEDGRVLISDFGLATGELVETATNLTQTGAVLGTPLYMAPEQLRGSPVTAKTDQFALCVCMWEALAGERPFHGASMGTLAIAMLSPPKIPTRVDRKVFEVLAKGLAAEPGSRWASVDALDAALAAATTRRSRKGIIKWAALAMLPTAAVAVASVIATRSATPASLPTAQNASQNAPPTPTPQNPTSSTTTDASRIHGSSTSTFTSPSTTPATSTSTSTSSGATMPHRSSTPPASPPSTSAHASWFETLRRATDRLGVGDGKGCLAELAIIAPVPVDRVEEAEQLRAACLMDAGDCAGGHAALEAAGRSHGKSAAAIAKVGDALDVSHCPIDAPPRERWPARARVRLGTLLAGAGSCKPVLEIIAKRNIQMENPHELEVMRVTCLARDHDCAGARVAWHDLNVPASTPPAEVPQLEKQADQTFVRFAPGCP